MKVPDEVLNKPGRLTDAEFELIKRHPGDGHAVLLETPGIGAGAAGHHPPSPRAPRRQRLPDRLAGDAISPMARMAAIVDVYDAITADRCYHKGMPAAEACARCGSGAAPTSTRSCCRPSCAAWGSTRWAAWCGSSRAGSGW
jgi:hypothetical protein